MPERDGFENATAYVISLCLVFTICVGLLRLWIRKSAYGRDDLMIGAATLLTFGHTGASYAALKYGIGRTWTDINLGEDADKDKLDQASLAAVILFFAALYLSKCAMLAFLSRITKTRSQILLYHICNGVVATLGVVSILIATAGCPSESGYYWAFHANADSCPSQSGRWEALTGLDIITEILLLALPIHLVWNLQMPLSKKAMITVAFWIRLPASGFSIGRNYYTLQLQHANSDPGLDSALVVIWMEVELAYAIGASTLSALKSFTESANTGFGLGFTRGKGDDSYGMSNVSGSSGARTEKGGGTVNTTSRSDSIPPSKSVVPARSQSRSHHQSPIKPPTQAFVRQDRDRQPPSPESHGLRLRPEPGISTYTSVSADPSSDLWRANSSVGSDSSGENDMVILRETAYEVQHDQAPMLPQYSVRGRS